MTSIIDKQIKESLTYVQQLKTNVDRIGREFKDLRTSFIESLQTLKPTNSTQHPPYSSTSTSTNFWLDRSEDVGDRFQQVSDNILNEHAGRSRPALVVFGLNSSGKTSFIQRFLGIGNILPSGIGPVTARIIQFTYASSERACFRVYETIEKTLIQYEGHLSHFFENQLQPDWESISDFILPHVKRPTNLDENSPEFAAWAKCMVEVSLPSNVLSLGIDVYDTPDFLSDNREQALYDNLHKLVKRIQPTLVFLYDNATISDTDKSCFLAMKDALDSLKRIPVFFLNTITDCISIVNDFLLGDDPDNVPHDVFTDTLHKKRQRCYELLLRRREMASEALGCLPHLVDDCTCLDIFTIPSSFDQWEKYTNLININSFRRIVKFAVDAYSMPTLTLARDMLATVDDYFDLVISSTPRVPNQWDSLRNEAIEWGHRFFDEYRKILPALVDDLMTNIFQLLTELKPQIIRQAVLTMRTNDPIDTLLQDNSKTIQAYIRLAVQEQVIKVTANNVISTRRDEVKALITNHFQQQRGLRKNELLCTAQRQVLNEISVEMLQRTSLFDTFLDNLARISTRCIRFWRGLPTRLSAYHTNRYNQIVDRRIMKGKTDVYQLLDAMDACLTLLNENNRRIFAEYCLVNITTELEKQKNRFRSNLIAWVEEQEKCFFNNILLNYKYVTQHLTDQQTLHNVISQFSGAFARIECQLLAAVELCKRGGILPIIGAELGRGGFCSVHMAQWDSETNLVVKKLLRSSVKNEQMFALEAHYHRAATCLCPNHIVPLLHIYENNINDSQRELWLIMPRYSRTLRNYLTEHIHEISFARVISFAVTIASALAELHRIEIVHGDLRASNIMLDENQQCYIIDFGTVRFGLSNGAMLSVAPSSSDVIDANVRRHTSSVRYDREAADIYSFGLLLYEMLPKPSYERLDTNVLSHLEELFRLIPLSDTTRKDYQVLIRACVDPNPANRPNAVELVRNLKLIQ